jgi:hypothetical protein
MRRTTIAVAVVLFGIQTHAGTMTQTAGFIAAPHGGTLGSYSQLNPSLAPLNAVVTTITVGGQGNIYTLTNPTSNTISFTASLFGALNIDTLGFVSVSTMSETLGPFQSTMLTTLPLPMGTQSSSAQTTNLSAYIGTGTLVVTQFGGGFQDSVHTDNPSIIVSSPPLPNFAFGGTETVTYYYGSTFLIPEPTSLVMLSLGLAAVAGLAWRQRKAKLAA